MYFSAAHQHLFPDIECCRYRYPLYNPLSASSRDAFLYIKSITILLSNAAQFSESLKDPAAAKYFLPSLSDIVLQRDSSEPQSSVSLSSAVKKLKNLSRSFLVIDRRMRKPASASSCHSTDPRSFRSRFLQHVESASIKGFFLFVILPESQGGHSAFKDAARFIEILEKKNAALNLAPAERHMLQHAASIASDDLMGESDARRVFPNDGALGHKIDDSFFFKTDNPCLKKFSLKTLVRQNCALLKYVPPSPDPRRPQHKTRDLPFE